MYVELLWFYFDFLNVHMNYIETKQCMNSNMRPCWALFASKQQYVDVTAVSSSKEENSLFAA